MTFMVQIFFHSQIIHLIFQTKHLYELCHRFIWILQTVFISWMIGQLLWGLVDKFDQYHMAADKPENCTH